VGGATSGDFGATVGETIAPNSDVVDEHAPELRTCDRHGDLLDAVDAHPARRENERLAFESGLVADAFRAPADRDAPVGLVYPLAMQTLACHADVGLGRAVSMIAGVALGLQNHDEAGYYRDRFRELTARDYEAVSQGAMFLTERQGGSDVGADETVAEPVAGSVGQPKQGWGRRASGRT
jgi:acyl-CoA dehydrogenase